MKIEIETESPEEATHLSEYVHLTRDQRRLIRLALSDYFQKIVKSNTDKPDYVKTAIEIITLHEYENIMRKMGMKFKDAAEMPSYFSIAPKAGETPEEFAERIDTRSWLEVDE